MQCSIVWNDTMTMMYYTVDSRGLEPSLTRTELPIEPNSNFFRFSLEGSSYRESTKYYLTIIPRVLV